MTTIGTLPDWAALAPALSLLATAFALLAIDAIDREGSNGLLLAGT